MNTVADREVACANCGRSYPVTQMDDRGWCSRCRAKLVKRSGLVARVVAFLFTLALSSLIFSRVGNDSRFLVAYVVMIVATYFLLVRITQRVAFEIFRARGVPPPPPE